MSEADRLHKKGAAYLSWTKSKKHKRLQGKIKCYPYTGREHTGDITRELHKEPKKAGEEQSLYTQKVD